MQWEYKYMCMYSVCCMHVQVYLLSLLLKNLLLFLFCHDLPEATRSPCGGRSIEKIQNTHLKMYMYRTQSVHSFT